MSIYNIDGNILNSAYAYDGISLSNAYDINGELIFPDTPRPDLPIPSGVLTLSEAIALPDILETGKGFTCTGLAYDDTNNQYLIGDIGKLLPSDPSMHSQIVIVSHDFSTIISTIDIGTIFPNMQDVQGITIDNDGSIWFCSPGENLVRHIARDGTSLSSFSLNRCTGITYDYKTNTLWCCTYNNMFYNMRKNGQVISSYYWNNSDTVDQCFIDANRGILYFDGGEHYHSTNYLYALDTETGEFSTACTLTDSYSVEGISLEVDRLVVVNDGYYHSAEIPTNLANIYLLNS